MPMNRRQFLIAPAAGAAMMQQAGQALAAPPANIRAAIDAARTGAPITPLIFGGYLEPATTRIWAEMLTDRKFANPIVAASAAAAPAAASPMRRLFGEPFRAVGPAGTVEMDTDRPFVGKHSPRIKLDASEPRGIQQSRLRVAKGKSYTGRVYLAGDPTAKVVVRLVWGPGANDSQTVPIRALTHAYQKFPFQFTPTADSQEARLEIVGAGSGTFHIGTASLMPADNMQGFHAGMIRHFREAGFKMAKWPGGNFVSGYDFYDGLGDVDKRPPRFQAMWSNRVESNDVGLHEFVALCGLLGAEPDLTINSGFGDAHSAAEEVEYCNGSVETRLGKLRAQNGHPEPFHIRIWTIGNEMYGGWQFGHMTLDQYWVKHNYIVDAMKKVDPTIKTVLSGATICERGIGVAERISDFFPNPWEAPVTDKPPFAFGSHEDWDGWLLANCADNVNYVSEHTYAYPRLAYDSEKQSFVNVDDPLPMQARRLANRAGEAFDAWQKYVEKMPALKQKGIQFIFDEWGCRHRQVGGNYQPPGMLTPLSYALFLNELFRNSDMVGASCPTGGLGTLLIDSTGEVVGFSAEGLVMKIMATHFAGAFPVTLTGNSPQQAVAGAPFVDIPTAPIGSPTYPLDLVAALSADRKRLLISVVNPSETAQSLSPQVSGVKLRGPGKLSQIAPSSVNAVNVAGQKPAVEILEHPLTALPDTVQVPPISISVYEFELA